MHAITFIFILFSISMLQYNSYENIKLHFIQFTGKQKDHYKPNINSKDCKILNQQLYTICVMKIRTQQLYLKRRAVMRQSNLISCK